MTQDTRREDLGSPSGCQWTISPSASRITGQVDLDRFRFSGYGINRDLTRVGDRPDTLPVGPIQAIADSRAQMIGS